MEMYNYNGVKLPALPEWDKTAYPYAIIYYVANETGVEEAHFGYSNQPFYLNTTYGIVTNTEGATIYASIYDAETKAWGEMYLFYEAAFALEPSKVIWINEKMLDDTGEEFMDKSEPEKLFPRRWWTNLLLAGLCSRPLPVSKREPVAYLYNGVRLPGLTEWDRTTFPYYYLYHTNNVTRLICIESYECTKTAEGFAGMGWGVKCLGSYLSTTLENGVWGPVVVEGLWAGPNSYMWNIAWANFKLLNEDGSVYREASKPDPIPVYE